MHHRLAEPNEIKVYTATKFSTQQLATIHELSDSLNAAAPCTYLRKYPL
jgi:hypothetical protein